MPLSPDRGYFAIGSLFMCAVVASGVEKANAECAVVWTIGGATAPSPRVRMICHPYQGFVNTVAPSISAFCVSLLSCAEVTFAVDSPMF